MDIVSTTKDLFTWSIPFLDSVPVIRAILGIILVFFAPGFAWSLLFFQRISKLERLVLSFGLSLATVTLSMLLLNIAFGLRISGPNALLVIICLIAVPLAVKYTVKYYKKRKNTPDKQSETEDITQPEKDRPER